MTGSSGASAHTGVSGYLRFAAPQVLTCVRIVLAMYAIDFALRQQTGIASTILLLGFATDAVDGACARVLGVETDFGQLLDFFADYVYFVVAPTVVALALAKPDGAFGLFLLTVPCVFAALRYARKARVNETEFPGIPGSPGAPTIAYALFVIATALLAREQAIAPQATAWLLMVGAPLLSALMVSRTRYPKLSAYPWILIPVLAGLAAMPFVMTAELSAATLVLIFVYVFAGPLVTTQATSARTRRSLLVKPPCS